VEQVRLDELWTFVFKKEKTLSAWEKLHTEYGDTWVWTAVDPTHKLVLSLVVGEHPAGFPLKAGQFYKPMTLLLNENL